MTRATPEPRPSYLTTVPKSSVATKFGRALRLHCPRCGGGRILRTWFKMKDQCPTCGLTLERGEGSDFWMGAYVFNLVVGEVIAIGVPIIWIILTLPDSPWTAALIVGLILAVVLPLLFFPVSRTLWLAWDLSFRPFEPGDIGRVH